MSNARQHINFLIKSKQTFTLSSSNYTTGIKGDGWSGKYVANIQSNRTFACFAKVKKAVKEKMVPEVKAEDVIYFQHNFKRDLYVEKVTNIDIKSAYATILFNDGYIDQETFAYLSKANKQERLASVGMLASRKEIFEFKNGNPISETEVVSPNSGFFFYAAKRTFEIMSDLKEICGQEYLYTWVDGIYFLPNKRVEDECRRYLDSINFKHTVDQLSCFDVRIKSDLIVVRFYKEDKMRLFNLPGTTSEFKRIMMDSILSFNNKTKTNEESTSRLSKGKS